MKMPANLKKRAITSVVLIAAMLGILFGDEYLVHKQILFICIFTLALFAAFEFQSLIPYGKPRLWIVIPAISLLVIGEWGEIIDWKPSAVFFADKPWLNGQVLPILAITFVLSMFIEMLFYDASSHSTSRLGMTFLAVIYLGVLPLFLMKLRHMHSVNGMLAFAATIFVPKFGDVGAYLTGSLIGKHKMTPTLSPKKTWEGFIGGMIVSVLTAIAINFIGPEPLFKNGVPEAVAFGLIVGLAGVFGDLFESMLKRDGQTKDASQSVPGFGGVLDVVDSVLFAAPVAYLFFVW